MIADECKRMALMGRVGFGDEELEVGEGASGRTLGWERKWTVSSGSGRSREGRERD